MTSAIRAFGWLIPWFLVLSVATLAVLLFVNRVASDVSTRNRGGMLGLWLLVCWYIGVALVTIVPESGAVRERFEDDPPRYSLIPLDGWFDQYGLNLAAVRETGLNVLLFIPGMILTFWFTKMRPKTAFLVLVSFGVLIEVIQLITSWGRALTVTDMLMYTAGAAMGWGMYRLLRRWKVIRDLDIHRANSYAN